jgi:quercetin dioxygenase-like cupin family protein
MSEMIRTKSITAVLITLLLAVFTGFNNTKNQEKMETRNNTSIFPKGEKLPNEWFSGNAYLTPLVTKDKNNEFSAGSVTFEHGARTNWHSHPKGQVLIVIEGMGFYQEKGKPAERIKRGDVVNIPENVEHWHGATATTKMVHIAITNYKDDVQVTWLHPVSKDEYTAVNNETY